jgi:ribonuclease HI
MTRIVKVFTDGTVYGNGKKDAFGASGFVFVEPEFEYLNKAVKIPEATNNITELTAIKMCLECILSIRKDHPDTKFIIYCDSSYSIQCVTKWYLAWQKNNWTTANKKPVLNKGLIQDILKVKLQVLDIIDFKHIRSHTPKPKDRNTEEYVNWLGNDTIDKLVKEVANTN